MITVELPNGFISDDFKKAEAYCKHFNCQLFKAKRGEVTQRLVTDDPLNIFWLGVNLHLRSSSNLTITPAEKYLT